MTLRVSVALAILAASASAQSGIPAITTGQYNTSRTAANPNEIILNPSNVNVNQFGKLFSWPVDGWIFAQPLYVPAVQIGGASTNVVYVATMHNSVYAFNADRGVFLASTGPGDAGYELQILDSYNNKTYANRMAGSIYKQAIPLVNPRE